MTRLNLELELPEKEAAKMVLLESNALQTMLREAVRNQRLAQLAEARRRIAAAGIAPMTMEEIQAEFDADCRSSTSTAEVQAVLEMLETVLAQASR